MLRRRRRQLRDPRWALYQVYHGETRVGDPVLAVSGAQAIVIVLRKLGGGQPGRWSAERISLTLGERTGEAPPQDLHPSRRST